MKSDSLNVDTKKVTGPDYMLSSRCMRNGVKERKNALFKGRIGELVKSS